MIAYLTSNIGGYFKENGVRVPAALDGENGFVESLKSRWKENAKVLFVASDPENWERSDEIVGIYQAALPLSGLSVGQMDLCDGRSEKLAEKVSDYDVVILGGGHVPTQNRFFRRIGLKEHLQDFDGILIGISAGSMNSAEVVYAQPEEEGESVDPAYERFLPGLGVTKVMVLPHYQFTREEMLDGKRLFEDITYPDSLGRAFYAIEDGSYVLVEEGKTTLFGAAYLIRDGAITQVCGKDKSISL